MKKKYTKKQITEAIAYWENVLKEHYSNDINHDGSIGGKVTKSAQVPKTYQYTKTAGAARSKYIGPETCKELFNWDRNRYIEFAVKTILKAKKMFLHNAAHSGGSYEFLNFQFSNGATAWPVVVSRRDYNGQPIAVLEFHENEQKSGIAPVDEWCTGKSTYDNAFFSDLKRKKIKITDIGDIVACNNVYWFYKPFLKIKDVGNKLVVEVQCQMAKGESQLPLKNTPSLCEEAYFHVNNSKSMTLAQIADAATKAQKDKSWNPYDDKQY